MAGWMQSAPRNSALLVGAILLIGLSALVASCRDESGSTGDESVAQSVDSVRDRLVDAFLTGVEYDNVRIRAERFDPVQRVLYNVQVTSPSGLLAAERAEMKVDLANMTAQLTLFDVVTAPLESSSIAESDETASDDGMHIVTYERLELDPFAIE